MRNQYAALGAISVAALIAHAGVPQSWASPVNGLWTEDFRWDTGNVPTMTSQVTLGFSSPYTVTVTGSQSAGLLTISNPDAILGLNSIATVNQFGSVMNNGIIIVNQNQGGSATQFDFEQSGQLMGTGTLRLNMPGAAARFRSASGVTVNHEQGHTIEGQGSVEATINNFGLISANVLGGQMRLTTNDKENSGLIQAVNGSTLEISSITINQALGGMLSADGVNSEVELVSSEIIGGDLMTMNGGFFEASGSNRLNMVNFDGVFNILNTSTLRIDNGIVNNGNMFLNSAAGGSATTLDFATSDSLAGNGVLHLNAPGSRARVRTFAGQTLLHDASHTIRGQGQVEASMVNNGLVSADETATRMRIVTNDKVNNNVIQAINGATLEVTSVSIDQSGGGLLLADGLNSEIELIGSTVVGGDIITSNGAFVDQSGTSTLDGVHLQGTVNVLNTNVLRIENSLINDGRINLNANAGGSATSLDIVDTMTIQGTGTIDLVAPGSRSRLRTIGTEVLTLGGGQIIEGQGQIEARLINEGLIRANDGAQMILTTDDKTNMTSITAINGSTIAINGIDLTQTLAARIEAVDAGSAIGLSGSTIISGNLIAAPGAQIFTSGSNTLNGVSLLGELNIPNAGFMTMTNSITNNGVINLNSTNGGSATTIRFSDSSSLLGSGTLNLAALGPRARLQTASGQTVINSANHTIEGQGQIEASLINDGLISANDGVDFGLNTNPKTNNAMIEAVNDSRLVISSITITQTPGAAIVADGAASNIRLSGATIAGGDLIGINGGDVENAGTSRLVDVNSMADISIPNASVLGLGAGTQNNGTIIVNSGAGGSATSLRFDDEFTLEGAGTIILNSAGSRARLINASGITVAELGEDQRLEGIGQVAIELVNHGTIAPGLSIGTMIANRPVSFESTAVFEVEVDGADADLFDNSSTLDLGGELNVSFIDGFAPAGYWSRTIMEGSSIVDKFDVVNMPTPPAGLVTRVVNTGTEIIIGQTCPSDLNLDGSLNFFDVSNFLNNFNMMDPEADLNNDGNWNFFDVSIFLNDFTVACGL